ncbi:MAG: hypothetical protein PHS34_09680, partial [Candidatus Omnitrophica bacterium]|nr:hypothetical protein [Candidatus Omnitrophota bacterium]
TEELGQLSTVLEGRQVSPGRAAVEVRSGQENTWTGIIEQALNNAIGSHAGGGVITNDMLSFLHANEIILTDEQVAALSTDQQTAIITAFNSFIQRFTTAIYNQLPRNVRSMGDPERQEYVGSQIQIEDSQIQNKFESFLSQNANLINRNANALSTAERAIVDTVNIFEGFKSTVNDITESIENIQTEAIETITPVSEITQPSAPAITPIQITTESEKLLAEQTTSLQTQFDVISAELSGQLLENYGIFTDNLDEEATKLNDTLTQYINDRSNLQSQLQTALLQGDDRVADTLQDQIAIYDQSISEVESDIKDFDREIDKIVKAAINQIKDIPNITAGEITALSTAIRASFEETQNILSPENTEQLVAQMENTLSISSGIVDNMSGVIQEADNLQIKSIEDLDHANELQSELYENLGALRTQYQELLTAQERIQASGGTFTPGQLAQISAVEDTIANLTQALKDLGYVVATYQPPKKEITSISKAINEAWSMGWESTENPDEWSYLGGIWAGMIDEGVSAGLNAFNTGLQSLFSGEALAWDQMLGDVIGDTLGAGVSAAVPIVGPMLGSMVSTVTKGLFGLIETEAEKAQKRIKKLERQIAEIEQSISKSKDDWDAISEAVDMQYLKQQDIEKVFGKIITDEGERLKIQLEYNDLMDQAKQAELKGNTERQLQLEKEAGLKEELLDGYDELLALQENELEIRDKILHKRREELGVMQEITGETAAGLKENIAESMNILMEQFTTENLQSTMDDLKSALNSGAISWEEYQEYVGKIQDKAMSQDKAYSDAQKKASDLTLQRNNAWSRMMLLYSKGLKMTAEEGSELKQLFAGFGITDDQSIQALSVSLVDPTNQFNKNIANATINAENLADSMLPLADVQSLIGLT